MRDTKLIPKRGRELGLSRFPWKASERRRRPSATNLPSSRTTLVRKYPRERGPRVRHSPPPPRTILEAWAPPRRVPCAARRHEGRKSPDHHDHHGGRGSWEACLVEARFVIVREDLVRRSWPIATAPVTSPGMAPNPAERSVGAVATGSGARDAWAGPHGGMGGRRPPFGCPPSREKTPTPSAPPGTPRPRSLPRRESTVHVPSVEGASWDLILSRRTRINAVVGSLEPISRGQYRRPRERSLAEIGPTDHEREMKEALVVGLSRRCPRLRALSSRAGLRRNGLDRHWAG